MDTKKYFAYGSNLNKGDLEEWCRRKGEPGWSPELLQNPVPAQLPDMKLIFDFESSGRNGGALNLAAAPGNLVPGVIFEVAEGGWDMLDCKEGAPNCYQRIPWTALTADGEAIEVMTYVVSPERREDHLVAPSEAYLEVVKKGYRAFGLNPRQLKAAAAVAAAADAPAENSEPEPLDAFFVYGTLMRCESRFDSIKACRPYCTLLAQCYGDLYDLGDYPGMTTSAEAKYLVTGELIRVKDVKKALSVLDRIEGFAGYGDGEEKSLFKRVLVTVDTCDGRPRQAWTYVIANEPPAERRIANGNWRESRGRWDSFTEKLVAAHARGNEAQLFESVRNGEVFPPSSEDLHMGDVERPLLAALRSFTLSERKIAQCSGRWVAVPGH